MTGQNLASPVIGPAKPSALPSGLGYAVGHGLAGLMVLALFAAAYFFYLHHQPAQYIAQGKILLLEAEKTGAAQPLLADASGSAAPSRASEPQEMLKTTHLIAHAMTNLEEKLAGETTPRGRLFRQELADPGLVNEILQSLPLATMTGPTLAKEQRNFLSRLELATEQQGRMISVGYRSSDPGLAAAVANQVIQSFHKTLSDQAIDRLKLSMQDLLSEISRVQKVIETKMRALEAAKASKKPDNQPLAAHLKASQNLLETLLLRYKEAQLIETAKMVPPQMRIVSKAMTPFRPVSVWRQPASFIYWLLAFLVVAAIILRGVFKQRSAQKKALDATSCPVPPVPSGLPSPTEAVAADSSKNDEVWPPEIGPLSLLEHADTILAWEMANSDCNRSVLLTQGGLVGAGNAGHLYKEMAGALANQLAAWGRSVVVIDLQASQGTWPQTTRKLGLSDLIDGRAGYADLIQPDVRHHCHIMSAGTRALLQSDFPSQHLHTLLQALEKTYDHVLVDASCIFDNQYALECLTIGSRTELLVAASPDILEFDSEIEHYFSAMGFAAVTLATQSMSEQGLFAVPATAAE